MGLLAVTVLVFGVALWLGLYLIGRDPRSPRLLLAGLGLGSYALGLGLDVLQGAPPPLALAPLLARLRWLLLFLPALCWFGTVVQLLPPEERLRGALWRVWAYGLVPLATALALFGPLARPASATSGMGGAAPLAYLLLSLLVLLPLLVALGFLWRAVRATELKNPRGVALASTLFFALGVGLLLVPLDTFPRVWLLLAIGGDLLLLGIAVAVLDAFDQGESLLPDFVRSLDASLIAALLFGGQVVLATFLGAGTSFPMLALLLATVATAIATQVFADRIETLVDAFALRRYRRAREVRAELRAAASAVPRTADILDLQALDEAEFARLTRRALSHFGDLARLAANPLTGLPLIEQRLAARGARDDTLQRASELKALLAESVARLKPHDKGDFGTADEWRYYNALYFPYIAGLKPYSQRLTHDQLNGVERQALDWFRASVPERTLYNWQTTAARLVAKDLRDRATGD